MLFFSFSSESTFGEARGTDKRGQDKGRPTLFCMLLKPEGVEESPAVTTNLRGRSFSVVLASKETWIL